MYVILNEINSSEDLYVWECHNLLLFLSCTRALSIFSITNIDHIIDTFTMKRITKKWSTYRDKIKLHWINSVNDDWWTLSHKYKPVITIIVTSKLINDDSWIEIVWPFIREMKYARCCVCLFWSAYKRQADRMFAIKNVSFNFCLFDFPRQLIAHHIHFLTYILLRYYFLNCDCPASLILWNKNILTEQFVTLYLISFSSITQTVEKRIRRKSSRSLSPIDIIFWNSHFKQIHISCISFDLEMLSSNSSYLKFFFQW